MINKLRRKFSLFAIASVFIFITLILFTINIVNFSITANDADNITRTIMKNGGHFSTEHIPFQDHAPNYSLKKYASDPEPGKEPMGPDSPEMKDSLRYFTVSFGINDEPTVIEYRINVFSPKEVVDLAKELIGKSTGWAKKIYRYRSWRSEDKTTYYVTVIDQGRELKPCFNVLYASLIGGGVGLIITIIGIYFASKSLIRPIEEADNKQKRFIANAAIALRTPVSIISIDNATLMKKNGVLDPNKSIDYQVKKLLDLANDLNAFSLISESKPLFEDINISNVTKEIVGRYWGVFLSSKKELLTHIEDNVMYQGDLGMIQKMLVEIMENSLKYSDSRVQVNVSKHSDRVVLEFVNDCKGIVEGSLDRVFDRFYRLDYKDHSIYEGNGIGLAIVKDIVDKHKGRAIAKGENGNFVLKIEL